MCFVIHLEQMAKILYRRVKNKPFLYDVGTKLVQSLATKTSEINNKLKFGQDIPNGVRYHQKKAP